MTGLVQDVRYALRSLRNHPGFTLIAILTLGLGIGGNGAIFSVINGILLRPPAGVREPERLVNIYTSDFSSGDYGPSAYPDYEAIRDAGAPFEFVAGYDVRPLSISAGGDAAMLPGAVVTSDYFRLLGLAPLQGRLLGPADMQAGGAQVAVISHGLWVSRLGSDLAAVGGTIRINGQPFTIVGIAPAGFTGLLRPIPNDVWLPVTADPILDPGSDNLTNMGSRWMQIIARLPEDVSIERAQSRMTALAVDRFEQFPDMWRTVRGDGRKLTVVPESQTRVPPQAQGAVLSFAVMLLVVVALVLVIACANIANLLLARATRRKREVAIRVSIGASRGRLVRLMLVESLLLATAGAAAGLLASRWLADAILRFQPPTPVPIQLAAPIDHRVLAYLGALALLTALAFGLLPALRSSRPDLVAELKGEATASRGRRFGLRNLLVMGQLAASLVLLLGAGLFVRSLQRAQGVDPGFDPSNTVVMTFDLQSNGYPEGQGRVFYQRLMEQLRGLPGVEAATLAQSIPLGNCCGRRGTVIEGYQRAEGESTEINWNVVDADYFRAMRIPLAQGRTFTEADRDGAPPVVMVNEAFGRRYWPGEPTVGKRVSLNGPDGPFREVVGVVRDGKYRSLNEDPLPFLFAPLGQEYRSQITLHVRGSQAPSALLAAVRAEVAALAPNLPAFSPTTLREQIAVAVLPQRIAATLLAVFGGLAAVLAALGLYGVTSYAVAQRTREFGIRSALGARRTDLTALVIQDGLFLTAMGVAIGLPLAVFLTRLASQFLFGVSPLDPLILATVVLLLVAATLAASLLPARKAAAVEPMEALRHD